MQLMSWTLGRLGSRFNLLFEPHLNQIRHGALGRFADQPMDLMIGLVEPDGTERVLPFTKRGEPLLNPEQFERINSITYRAYSEKYNLRFEFNIHSPFYPQHEKLCILPAFYLEMRVNPANTIRWLKPKGPTPKKIKLFIRLQKPNTKINALKGSGRIDIEYDSPLTLSAGRSGANIHTLNNPENIKIQERIVSLTPGSKSDDDGQGLTLSLPVTSEGSGTKWRLVWGAHTKNKIIKVGKDESQRQGKFRYTQHWPNIDEVMRESVAMRDERLGLSRRFEKLFDQSPLRMGQRHLIHQSFQTYICNTFWCQLDKPRDRDDPNGKEWFSVMEGSRFFQSPLDVGYNTAIFPLMFWPKLLALQLQQWAQSTYTPANKNGKVMHRDLGIGFDLTAATSQEPMPVELNANYLLLHQIYAHWTGDLSYARKNVTLLNQVTQYLISTDTDNSGFPSIGINNTIDDGSPAVSQARKQTYLATKRIAALRAAADLLGRIDDKQFAESCDKIADIDSQKIEDTAWLGDHYAVCVDRSATGIKDPRTGKPLPYINLPGWDAYSIYTTNALLLPAMIGYPPILNEDRIQKDLTNSTRETVTPYGSSHTSYEKESVWVSQNIWRDLVSCYLELPRPHLVQRYWDLQTLCNTSKQSLGYTDSYMGNDLCFNPRGVASLGYAIAQTRLIIDRLAPGGARISVKPDRTIPQRWPLFPLADWKAGKIPICVVELDGSATIEGESDPVMIRGDLEDVEQGSGLIG